MVTAYEAAGRKFTKSGVLKTNKEQDSGTHRAEGTGERISGRQASKIQLAPMQSTVDTYGCNLIFR